MKVGSLVLQPLGEVTGCLLMEPLESAPGAMWDPGGPARTALCTGTLPPSCHVSASSENPGGWRGETAETGQKAPAGRMKRKKKKITSCWISHAPLFSRARSLSLLTLVLKVAQHIQLSLFFITAHILPSPLPETCCLFYPPLAQTPFSPLQLHPRPNRCSVAKLQSTYVTFFN